MNSSKRSKINFKGVALAATVLAGSGAALAYPLSVLNFKAFALNKDSDGMYIVSNEDELIEALTTGVTNIKLTDDIVITKTWTPVNYNKPIGFEGQGHKIIGLKNSLFAEIVCEGTSFIHSVVIEKPDIKDYSGGYTGVFARKISGDFHVENCHIIGGAVEGNTAGSMFGDVSGVYAKFQECTSSAEVRGLTAGGLIGSISGSGFSASIWGCVSAGKIVGSEVASGMIGLVSDGIFDIKNSIIGADLSAKDVGIFLFGGSKAISNCVFTGRIDEEHKLIMYDTFADAKVEDIYYKHGGKYKAYGGEKEYSLKEVVERLNASPNKVVGKWEERENRPYLVLSAEVNGSLNLDGELLVGETDGTSAKVIKGVKRESVVQSGVSEIRQNVVAAALEKIEKKIGANSGSSESVVVEIPANPQSKITVDLGEEYRNKKVYVTCITDKGYFYRTNISNWAMYDSGSEVFGVTELGDKANIAFDGLNESMIFIITPAN